MSYYLKIALLGFINVQKLAIEIFIVKFGLAFENMKNVFPIIENPYT